MTLSTMKVLCTTVILHHLAFAGTSYCKYIWCECQPCANLTTVENCSYPTTQATANSQKPLHVSSKNKLDDIPVYSVGSIVGAAIGGALFGFVVTATVFVYFSHGVIFRRGQRGNSNNSVFRLHDFNNGKLPKQLGDDSVVYNEITDEMELAERLQTFRHQEELAKKENVPELTNLKSCPSDNHASCISATFREDEREMASTVEERDQILHNVKPAT